MHALDATQLVGVLAARGRVGLRALDFVALAADGHLDGEGKKFMTHDNANWRKQRS